MKRSKAVYMLCTNDEFELPVLVDDSIGSIAKYLGTSKGVCLSNLARKKPSIGKGRQWKLERLYISEDEGEECD